MKLLIVARVRVRLLFAGQGRGAGRGGRGAGGGWVLFTGHGGSTARVRLPSAGRDGGTGHV
ncbi:hypothetical protein, partial [Streptomyces sp. SID335]|uniref:hypothetical protein n=1 Tax=Streptomyces sp. SID335 TaxID=2690261 RepID=UPI001F418452